MNSTQLYKCDYGKFFHNKNLKRHMNARHNDVVKVKKYKYVDQCDNMFCRSDNLRDQLIRVHETTRTEATACVHK